MKSKEELKEWYIEEKTKGWDEDTKQQYMVFVEDDFLSFYEGYVFAHKELNPTPN